MNIKWLSNIVFYMKKGYLCYQKNGLKYTLRKARAVFFNRPLVEMDKWVDIEKQKETRFERNIKISIVVPVFNTPEILLREMIESVIAQTYQNWELCLADGGDDRRTEQVCKELEKKEKRIKYKKIGRNFGISGNTNVAIEMASGEFIALFDHDDLLHPSAL